jgi:hypothetical protein
MNRTRKRHFLLLAISVLVSLLVAEGMARAVEKWWGPDRFVLLRSKTYESFFHYYGGFSGGSPQTVLDPLLGWRNAYPAWEGGVARTGWRTPEALEEKHERIVLIGDSFVFGLRLRCWETISSYLQSELNNEVDVVNLGVRGWGLDQMALSATRVAPSFRPRTVILAFIAADLARSCTRFGFNMSKPYFVLKNGVAQPAGIPVPTLQQKAAEHRRPYRRLEDALAVFAAKSRLVRLVGQVLLQRQRERCVDQLNPAILDYAIAHSEPSTKLLFVHLDGNLPPEFEKRVKAMPNFISVASQVGRISRELGIPPKRQPDGHPEPELNRIYARALAEALGWN